MNIFVLLRQALFLSNKISWYTSEIGQTPVSGIPKDWELKEGFGHRQGCRIYARGLSSMLPFQAVAFIKL